MGSIFKRSRDNRWVAQISSGPRGSRSVRQKIGRSRREAEELLKTLLADAGAVDPQVTVGAFLRSWLVTAARSVKPSTLQTYEIVVRRQLTPALGDVKLARLGPAHVEAMVRDLAETMSPKGVANVLGVLSAALAHAERQELVTRNVAQRVKPPRVERREIAALEPVDVKKIMAAVKGERLEALFILALATGLRMAELLGLRWVDVDLDSGTVKVVYALARVDGKYALVEPKTRRSRRTIALPEFALIALRSHRTEQLAERLAAGVPTAEGLVFVTPDGLPINGGWLSHHWAKIADRAGTDVTFHQLRHGQASLLVALGVHPRVVAERLGHSTVAMAMDRYAHIASESDREAARLLDAAVTVR